MATRVSEVAALFSPLRSPDQHQTFFHPSPSLIGSPNPSDSPYRLPPIPKSTSGNDLVSGIVDKFNSLSVTDREQEERARCEKQIAKLKAALERATVAREEAEEEAVRLRERLNREREERQREKGALRERCAEYEKKYEKAKDRFKMQRAKNEEAMQKVQADFLEKEKEHWRDVAKAQEVEEWERQLRVQAQRLMDFIDLERRFELDVARRRWSASAAGEERHVKIVSRRVEAVAQVTQVVENMHIDTTTMEPDQYTTCDEIAVESRPASRSADEHPHQPSRPTITAQESSDSLREVTPEGPPSMSIRPFQTPAKQVVRVPVDFGEDKENQEPSVADVMKTPMTMDRAAALAAIEYRRGRARSFMNAQTTPKTTMVVDKRDVSAPAVVTMSVGRKK